jgi:hypothetical protein
VCPLGAASRKDAMGAPPPRSDPRLEVSCNQLSKLSYTVRRHPAL